MDTSLVTSLARRAQLKPNRSPKLVTFDYPSHLLRNSFLHLWPDCQFTSAQFKGPDADTSFGIINTD